MTGKNDFETFARCCTRLADKVDIEDAAMLLMVAQAWTELAERAERTKEALGERASS